MTVVSPRQVWMSGPASAMGRGSTKTVTVESVSSVVGALEQPLELTPTSV
jgi:hypothetical protein